MYLLQKKCNEKLPVAKNDKERTNKISNDFSSFQQKRTALDFVSGHLDKR